MNLFTLMLAHFKSATLFTLFFTLVFSCNPKTSDVQRKGKAVKHYTLTSPAIDNIYSRNDSVYFKIASLKKPVIPDSILLLSGGKSIAIHNTSEFNIPCILFTSKYGKQNLRIKIFFSDSLSQIITSRIVVLPDNPPQSLKYKVIRKIPHDPQSFTQGLVYYEGKIYEGTGQLGKSKLMKIDPADGKILLQRSLGSELFGEGIVIHNQQIFQLTYRSRLGFVYDLSTFEQIREFDLQTAEGWGLTSDGESLIVSDGSSSLYFYDPVYFSQTSQLEVCNNKGIINRLNELEYVNGHIWSNVYGEKYILQIDAVSGAITGKLDLESLFPSNIPDDYDHVLNGIAYNSDQNSYYITGKLWPVIYEILILP